MTTYRVRIVSPNGPPGPRGPAGPPGVGSGGAYRYEHTQAVAASVWTVNHNLGAKPNVQVFSVGGLVVEAEVFHQSDNVALITFDAPFAGAAVCS